MARFTDTEYQALKDRFEADWKRNKEMRKREKRVRTEQGRLGTDRVGEGWAAKQAAKRSNRGKKLSMRAVRRRLKQKGGNG